MKLIFSNSRNFKFSSNYSNKLFKKYLSLKLFINLNKNIYLNIFKKKLKKKNISLETKIFYNRKEKVPLRILRYYLYFNFSKLQSYNINTEINHKLMVYNGKRAKPINIYKD